MTKQEFDDAVAELGLLQSEKVRSDRETIYRGKNLEVHVWYHLFEVDQEHNVHVYTPDPKNNWWVETKYQLLNAVSVRRNTYINIEE